jgi:hypothetical protein
MYTVRLVSGDQNNFQPYLRLQLPVNDLFSIQNIPFRVVAAIGISFDSVDIEGTALASRNTRLIATTPDGSRLDATFNLSKRFLGISTSI